MEDAACEGGRAVERQPRAERDPGLFLARDRMEPADRLADEVGQAVPRGQRPDAGPIAGRDHAAARLVSAGARPDRQNDAGKPSAPLRGAESSGRGPRAGLRDDRANEERQDPARTDDARAAGRARRPRAQERLHLRPGQSGRAASARSDQRRLRSSDAHDWPGRRHASRPPSHRRVRDGCGGDLAARRPGHRRLVDAANARALRASERR